MIKTIKEFFFFGKTQINIFGEYDFGSWSGNSKPTIFLWMA
jgi:hypothetical protein